jgi:hypothetical protein
LVLKDNLSILLPILESSLQSETGEDESEFSDDASGSGSADFTDSGSDDGF